MKKSSKWKIICLVCLTAVSLTGCGDRKDIENSSYVLAMGFEKINDKENAKKFLESLIALYPDSNEAKEAGNLLIKK